MTPGEYVEVSYGDVALAAALILVNGAISLSLGLGLERRLLMAATRMVVQLLLVGLILEWVFSVERVWGVVAVGTAMAILAARAAIGQVERPYPGLWTSVVVPIWASAWLVTIVGTTAIVPVRPWHEPQYVIPLLGMVLGNALTGISLGIDRLASGLHDQRARIETALALGATRSEAARPVVATAVRSGMIPILNSMAVAGIVSLPGMMTGQLLAGIPPAQAVRYQIVIFFLIAAGTALGTIGSVLAGTRRLFDTDHRFRPERLD